MLFLVSEYKRWFLLAITSPNSSLVMIWLAVQDATVCEYQAAAEGQV